MTSDTVKLDAIRVEDRARREYDGIDSLAASIQSLGLLHPIVVTRDLRLIAGGRRLHAVKALGWDTVPVTYADSISEVAEFLQAESDENAERMPLKPTEAADLARKIEEVLAPLARERMEAGGNLPQGRAPKTRDVAAKAAGRSATSIRKVRVVQEVVESESTPEPVRAVAREALAEMDNTGKVDAAHKRVKAAVTAAELVEEFPDLAFYVEKGDPETAIALGTALRGFAEPQRTSRVNALRATVTAERRKLTEPAVDAGPDYVALADAIFVAFNNALQVASKQGGADTIRAAAQSANPLAVELWRSQFERIQTVASELLDATRPTLRRVQ